MHMVASTLLLAAFIFTGTPLSAASFQLNTTCTQQDCFKFGWTTLDPNGSFRLTCTCKNASCEADGWTSDDNFGSHYDVTCKQGGCFVSGWISMETIGETVRTDIATCRHSDCLQFGWDVASDYEGGGGLVECTNNDCRRLGGSQHWRGRHWQSTCLEGDCYHVGWRTQVD